MQKEQWNHKKWVRLIISKIGPPRYPKTHPGPKRHPKGPRRAKIGINASHAVQLTSLRPKKTDLNPTPQRSAPLTWNQPGSPVFKYEKIELLVCIYEISRAVIQICVTDPMQI